MAATLSASPSPAARDAGRAEAHRQAGLAASRAGDWARAREEFTRATRLAPADALMWMNLARACERTGDLAGASEAAGRATVLDPASPVAVRMAAEYLLQQHRPDQAVRLFEAMDAGAPRDAEWHAAHGNALFLAGRAREAVDAYFRSLSLDVAVALTHYRLGLCFKDLAMPLEASECFRTAVSLDEGSVRALALSLLVHEGRQACDWTRTEEDTRALLAAVDAADVSTVRLLSPFALLALDATPAQLLHVARLRSQRLAEGVLPMAPPGPRRAGRLRVGYLSSDFHAHATSLLIAEMLERRDTRRFEVFLYSHSRDDGSAIGQRVRAACEHFVDVTNDSHRAIAERIRADGIDVLVDLKGHTRDSRMDVLAWRPAPVQATWLGYPATTGADFIDYFIGDEVTTPLSLAADYSEHLAQLPVCYQPNDRSRPLPPAPPRAELGLPADAVVLCCFNQTYKLSPHLLDLWARVMAGAPRAVLWMLAWNPHAQANLLRELANRGVGPDRVVFAPRLDLADHIARLRAADLFLDTWPCNAHTTASEALWAGVPVLTVPGATFASRVAASLVRACGLPDLACPDENSFVALATGLANEPETLQGVKLWLDSNRATSPLFDAARFARDFEALLLRMHERRLAGLPPTHLPAQDPDPEGAR